MNIQTHQSLYYAHTQSFGVDQDSDKKFRPLAMLDTSACTFEVGFALMYLNLIGSYNNKLGDNCIQNFHLGRYIVGYTVGNLVLRRRVSGAIKRDLRTYIRGYTSPNENFEYGYPHSNALLTFFPSKGQ